MGQYGSDFRIFGEQNLSTPLFKQIVEWLVDVVEFVLEKFSKYFDTWDWGLIGEASLFTPLSSEATGILDIGQEMTKSNNDDVKLARWDADSKLGTEGPPRLLVDKNTKDSCVLGIERYPTCTKGVP